MIEEVGKTSFTFTVKTSEVVAAMKSGALDLLAEKVAGKIKEHK